MQMYSSCKHTGTQYLLGLNLYVALAHERQHVLEFNLALAQLSPFLHWQRPTSVVYEFVCLCVSVCVIFMQHVKY